MSDLVKVGTKFGSYLNSVSPQIKDGSLQWYISGSLASTVLAGAKSITELKLDSENMVVGENDVIQIDGDQKQKLETFSRKLGMDIDVVNVNGSLFGGAQLGNKPTIRNVKENVDGIYDLMGWPSLMDGSGYIDNLDYEREISNHPVARVNTENGEVYVTAPPELFAHKLHETMVLREMLDGKFAESVDIQYHYEKSLRDMSTMFNGFKDLYEKGEFSSRIYSSLMQKSNSIFSDRDFDASSSMKEIMRDSSKYLKSLGDEELSQDMSNLFGNLLYRRASDLNKEEKGDDSKQVDGENR